MTSKISLFGMFFLSQRSKVRCTKYAGKDVSSPAIEMIVLCNYLVEICCDSKDPTIPDTSL